MLSRAGFATLIPIRNMNRALKFYTKTLGGTLNMRGKGEMKDSWASVSLGRAEIWLVAPEKHEKRDLAYSAFVVKDIKKTVDGLKKKRAKFLPAEKMGADSKTDGPISYSPYGAVATLKDSEGNLLMIWENALPM
jgi:predicted enzyme related to lactoylglutathione lyase